MVSNNFNRKSSSGEWEDVHDGEKPPSDSPEVDISTTRSSTRPRRRAGTKTVFIAATPPKTSPKKPSTQTRPRPAVSHISRPVSPPPAVTRSKEEIEAAVWQGARSGTVYILEVLSSFFFLMKKPLAVFLVIWVLAATLNALSNQMRMVFAPLCVFPGISSSWLCVRPSTGVATQQGAARPSMHADFPSMVEMQSKSFEQLLDESVGGSGLALEIKKAEMATTDLVTLVRVSKLTSKDLLAEALVEFVTNAKDTSRGLLKLSAKVSSAVDDILAINDYALRTIEAPNNSGSSLIAYVWPFGRSKTDLLTTTFSQSLGVLSTSFQRLIIEAEVSLHSLDKLELQLNSIQDILTREDVHLSDAQSDVLAELWTKLGGNREQLRSFRDNLRLLKELGSYRSRALAHVVGALQALQTLSADMEELRERVAAPELIGGDIPVEVHVRSIRSGIERLKEGRLRAKEKEEAAVARILGPLE